MSTEYAKQFGLVKPSDLPAADRRKPARRERTPERRTPPGGTKLSDLFAAALRGDGYEECDADNADADLPKPVLGGVKLPKGRR
jgi:hypothetical protein